MTYSVLKVPLNPNQPTNPEMSTVGIHTYRISEVHITPGFCGRSHLINCRVTFSCGIVWLWLQFVVFIHYGIPSYTLTIVKLVQHRTVEVHWSFLINPVLAYSQSCTVRADVPCCYKCCQQQ